MHSMDQRCLGAQPICSVLSDTSHSVIETVSQYRLQHRSGWQTSMHMHMQDSGAQATAPGADTHNGAACNAVTVTRHDTCSIPAQRLHTPADRAQTGPREQLVAGGQ